MSGAMPTARDAACLAEWRVALDRQPGVLPAGVVPVHTRLIRSVGRGRLPDGGDVFVKTMGFPRARDRLRYWVRRLPGLHEAAMLRAASAAGIACPEVVAAWGRRDRVGLPRASTLVTRALDVDPGRVPRLAECAALARRLADAGILHRDLHGGNFAPCAGGGLAVLDLQSALRVGSVGAGAQRRLAARLLAHEWPELESPRAVVDAGLIAAADLPWALAAARRWRAHELRRRIRRCLTESSEFTVRHGLGFTLYQRRRLPPGGVWREGGRELRRVWLGQRVREVMAGEPAILGALFWKWWWLPGRSSVYIGDPNGVALFDEHCQRWLEALRHFRADPGGTGSLPGLDPEAPLSWSGGGEI